jgi:hypothetical protein
MGGTLGVSVMGAALSARLTANLSAANLDPALVSQLLDPLPGAELVINEGARIAMAGAISLVFVIAFIAAALALVSVFIAPNTELKEKTAESEPVLVSAD